jgi:RNA polymerase sigma factor (sigma-70 family)
MANLSDQQLLRDYGERRTETAFAELVRRHVDFVYSAALRMVCDAHLAQDVTQGVFLALAQNARQLADRPVLAGWLHRTAQNLAANMVRSETRRRAREQEAAAMNQLLRPESEGAWDQIAPHLDAALDELNESERDALLLRYFQRKSAREMAQTLGVSEEAAQKRVSRAVERLREGFARRGLAVGASGLVAGLSVNAVQAAPAGLAAGICAAATAAGPILPAIATKTTLVIMKSINAKVLAAATAAAVITGTAVHFAEQSEASRLQAQNQALLARQEELAKDRDEATSALAARNLELEQSQSNKAELLRLRSEVGRLRGQTPDLQKLRQQNAALQTALNKAAQTSATAQSEEETNPEAQMGIAKMNDAKLLMLGLIMYATDHQDLFPADFDQTSNYLAKAETERPFTGTNQFELLIQGSMRDVRNAATTIAVREKTPSLVNGARVKTYGFADGHAEIKREPPEGFEAWEKQHIQPQ